MFLVDCTFPSPPGGVGRGEEGGVTLPGPAPTSLLLCPKKLLSGLETGRQEGGAPAVESAPLGGRQLVPRRPETWGLGGGAGGETLAVNQPCLDWEEFFISHFLNDRVVRCRSP